MAETSYETCSECGSEDLEFKAWVDKHQKFVDHVDDGVGNNAWCRKCEDHVTTNPI